MEESPEHLKRYPTRAGREALAARLGLTIDPFSQDWEWEVAAPAHFEGWLAVYRDEALSDSERFSLMEMLTQCVEDTVSVYGSPEEVERLPQWQTVAGLLRERPCLHMSSIYYWSVFGREEPEEQFRVSIPMRKVWTAVRPELE